MKKGYPFWISFWSVENYIFSINVIQCKGLENKGFPKCNHQWELNSDEENSVFEGIYVDERHCLYFYLLLKELNEMSL